MADGGEFVEGWQVAQVLGEGAYGEVRLLVHARTGACVALKAVGAGEDSAGAGAREAALHRALRHAHVLRCLGARRHGRAHYLFLEWAAGGELFERIEPDVGLGARAARRYWRQLAAGLAYLHARGVAHRDIKPENLLLDHRDNLKISDFGMATLFRHGARERLLARVCGTVPYAAPEVLRAAERAYRAPPADLWAAALVLLAMLAGELPWERAAPEDPRFGAWCAGAGASGAAWAGGEAATPGWWRRLSDGARALLRRALRPRADERASLAELMRDPWLAETHRQEGTERVSSSQPLPLPGPRGGGGGGGGEEEGEARDLSAADMDALLSHSQPAHADDVLLPLSLTQAAPAGALQRLARRLPRVWLAGDEAAALAALERVLDDEHLPWRRLQHNLLAVECGGDVRMRAWAAGAGAGVAVLEFRRSRGCGLAFQRCYRQLRAALAALVPLAAPPHDDHAPAPSTPMDEG